MIRPLLLALVLFGAAAGAQGDEGAWRLTYYAEPFTGGTMACGGTFYPTDVTVVAAPVGVFDCYQPLEVCTEVRCLVVTVQDRCGGCGPRHLDLSRAAYETLGSRDSASVTPIAGTWMPQPKALPASGNGGYK